MITYYPLNLRSLYMYIHIFLFQGQIPSITKTAIIITSCSHVQYLCYSPPLLPKLLKIHQWVSLFYWWTCSFIIMNLDSYFQPALHTQSHCCKKSLGYQICSWKQSQIAVLFCYFWEMFVINFTVELFKGFFLLLLKTICVPSVLKEMFL